MSQYKRKQACRWHMEEGTPRQFEIRLVSLGIDWLVLVLDGIYPPLMLPR